MPIGSRHPPRSLRRSSMVAARPSRRPGRRPPRAARGPRRAYLVLSVIHADRFAPFGPVATQVVDGQEAAVLAHRVVDSLSQFAVVYHFGAPFGDQAEGSRQVFLDEGLPRPQGRPTVTVDVSRVLGERLKLRPDPT